MRDTIDIKAMRPLDWFEKGQKAQQVILNPRGDYCQIDTGSWHAIAEVRRVPA